jgi:hypothetical protein
MLTLLKKEPALILGFVQAVVAVGVSFGLQLSVDQVGALMALSAAALGLVVRHNVSPAVAVAPVAVAPVAPPAAPGLLAAG